MYRFTTVFPIAILLIVSLFSTSTTSAQSTFDPDADRGSRIGLEVGGGLAGTLGGGLVGLGLGLLICEVGDLGDKEWGCLAPAVIATGLGAWGGLGAGVYIAGDARDANGGYGWMTLGQLGGSLLAWGMIEALMAMGLESEVLTIVFAVTIPLAGAILGYELSVTSYEIEPETASNGLTAQPFPLMLWLGSF